MARRLDQMTYEERSQMRSYLFEAQTEMEGMIVELEDALPTDANRFYSADEETIKSLLEDARDILGSIGIVLNKIELTPAGIREHMVAEGETLPKIAAAELGDAKYWPLIADANDMIDPMATVTGQKLLIPRPESEHGEVQS